MRLITFKVGVRMKSTISKQTGKSAIVPGRQRSYNEIIEFLDTNWQTNANDTSLSCIKQLDKAFSNVSQKVNTILVAGTKGKSLTINFAAQLLQAEGLTVGAFYAPHILSYNERLSVNKEFISNKAFTDIANEVLNTAESLGLTPNSFDALTIMALLFFQENKVDVALLEVTHGGIHNQTSICYPKIAAITRVSTDNPAETQAMIEEVLSIVKPNTHVVAADQSKLSLQVMLEMVNAKGGIWGMPIRKLAQLNYPMEQLHGRCAALAERISQIYINNILAKESVLVAGSLLAKQKGQRGRPTLEAKRQLELNPKKTVEQFWKETESTLPGRFQLLDKEKPTILLDNASNLDSFENLLLGIRLLSYQRSLKGLTLIVGCNNSALNVPEFLKTLRYFFKKTSGQVIICPSKQLPGETGDESWSVEKITNDLKSMKIKARSAKTFGEAFEAAQKTVDERNGLVVITGGASIINQYWNYKGIKKL